MSSRHYRRRLSRYSAAAVDQPASPAERVFAALTVATMLVVSAYLILL